MNEICIAKKMSRNGVDFLDFALDDNDKLMVWTSFKSASEYLKTELGENSREILDYIITTPEAHATNPYMIELVENGFSIMCPDVNVELQSEPQSEPTNANVECYFLLNCEQFEISNPESIIDKVSGKVLVPVIAFLDPANPTTLANVPNFKLQHSFIGVIENN
jgi:hypothetical protein